MLRLNRQKKFELGLLCAIIAIVLAIAGTAHCQTTTTTVTGTIKSLGDSVVTTGKLVFTLKPSVDVTVYGKTRFTPKPPVSCKITASGIKAWDGVSACSVTKNTAIAPAGTYYQIDLCPENICTAKVNFFAYDDTKDFSAIVPTPGTTPSYIPASNVATPVNASDATNKSYVDTQDNAIWKYTPRPILAIAPFYSSLNQAIQDAIAAGGGVVDARYGTLNDLGSFNPGTNAAVTILLGPRVYYIGQVTLNDSLHITGAGDADNGTVIQSTDKNVTPFVIPTGAVQNVVLKGFRLYGAGGNTVQKGFNIVASVNGGGLWYSKFQDLTLMGFMGNGFNFDGSAGGGPMGVNQFIDFSNVKVFRPTGGAAAIRLYGSNGQFTFDQQCQFDGQAKGDGNNIEILSSSATLMPYSITFEDMTCQQADLCANISGALSVVFDKPHLENLNAGWLLTLGAGGVSSYNVVVVNGEIQTTGVNGGSGYLMKTTAGDLNSNATFMNNRISTNPDIWFDGFWSNLMALNNEQPDGYRYKSILPILNSLRVGGIASGSGDGDGTFARNNTQGAVYFGLDGVQILRSGNDWYFGDDKTMHYGVMQLANSSTALSRYAKYTATLSPVAVAANTCAAQSVTVTGLQAADIIIAAKKPTEQAGLALENARATGANTATLQFCNNTAGSITPTASESYTFVVVQ